MNTICSKKKILNSLEEKINGHISVNIQFNIKSMKEYCTKSFEGQNLISPEYSGKIYKHEWDMNFLERKPQLKKVSETPFTWQLFLKENILLNDADDRTVDWIIDPVGNTGKSSFARYYISKESTDGIFMKIDNLAVTTSPSE